MPKIKSKIKSAVITKAKEIAVNKNLKTGTRPKLAPNVDKKANKVGNPSSHKGWDQSEGSMIQKAYNAIDKKVWTDENVAKLAKRYEKRDVAKKTAPKTIKGKNRGMSWNAKKK